MTEEAAVDLDDPAKGREVHHGQSTEAIMSNATKSLQIPGRERCAQVQSSVGIPRR